MSGGSSLRPSPTILVVDDEGVNRRLMSARLAKDGYTPLAARNGFEALEMVSRQAPSAIFLDIMMPGIDGLETLRRLRALPRAGRTPVLFMSAGDDPGVREQGLALGGVDFIQKSVAWPEVRARLERRLAEAGEKNALEEGLREAAALQEASLPSSWPASSRWGVAARLEPCALVAGDLYGWTPRADGGMGVWVLDVSGHGPAAAIVGTLAGHLLDRILVTDTPAQALARLEAEFPEGRFDRYLTAACVVLYEDGRILSSTAGHPEPLLIKPAQTVGLRAGGGPVGWGFRGGYEQNEAVALPGDRLILYSDGVTEARDAEGRAFGAEGLAATARRCARGALACVGALWEAVEAHRAGSVRDDVVILCLERRSGGGL